MTLIGTITITDGNIAAIAGESAAVIGTGEQGSITSINISGDTTITATGGTAATGIGGGKDGTSEKIHIDSGKITASGGHTAVGGYTSMGHITLNGGTLYLPTGEQKITKDPSTDTFKIFSGASILGSESSPTQEAIFSSSVGYIDNRVVIALSETLVTDENPKLKINSNNYLLRFNDADSHQEIHVFGPSIASGYRSLPPDRIRSGFQFDGWLLNDGKTFLNEHTNLSDFGGGIRDGQYSALITATAH